MIVADTNVLLWLFMGDTRLSLRARGKIEQNPANYLVSIVSLWEIATKQSIGKLELAIDIHMAVEEAGFTALPLEPSHIRCYEALPLLHRDPFDRMLVAQALSEGVSLLTSDVFLKNYGVKIIDARRS